MSRRPLLPLLFTLLAAFGCEPAEPVDPVDAGPVDDALPDIMRPDVDAMPGCPDDDGDGVVLAECADPGTVGDCDDSDPRIRPGASDPCGDGVDQDCDGADTRCPEGCVPGPEIAPCDGVDDDCDGVVDECADREVCEADRCVGQVGAECTDERPCARGAACVDGRCAAIEPGGICADDVDCPADAVCRVEPACDPIDDRCYALQGGQCTASCDCSGALLCDTDAGRCVTCVVDAQCDDPAVCIDAGLCAAPTALGGEGDAWLQLLSVLVRCRVEHDGTDEAVGCARLDTATLSVDAEMVGALDPAAPGPTCDEVALQGGGFTADDIAVIGELFGCEEAAPTLVWTAPVPAEREAAACVGYLPPWAGPEPRRPGVSLTPCNSMPYARPSP